MKIICVFFFSPSKTFLASQNECSCSRGLSPSTQLESVAAVWMTFPTRVHCAPSKQHNSAPNYHTLQDFENCFALSCSRVVSSSCLASQLSVRHFKCVFLNFCNFLLSQTVLAGQRRAPVSSKGLKSGRDFSKLSSQLKYAKYHQTERTHKQWK